MVTAATTAPFVALRPESGVIHIPCDGPQQSSRRSLETLEWLNSAFDDPNDDMLIEEELPLRD